MNFIEPVTSDMNFIILLFFIFSILVALVVPLYYLKTWLLYKVTDFDVVGKVILVEEINFPISDLRVEDSIMGDFNSEISLLKTSPMIMYRIFISTPIGRLYHSVAWQSPLVFQKGDKVRVTGKMIFGFRYKQNVEKIQPQWS